MKLKTKDKQQGGGRRNNKIQSKTKRNMKQPKSRHVRNEEFNLK